MNTLPFDAAPQSPRHGILFQSKVMQRVIDEAISFANSSATVLITGESGSGKELFARLIHRYSPRRDNVYSRVNCAALSETLMESELFGHERGAFTGAVDQRIGRLEWAHQGTLLLDEISEIPVGLQAKLLRALEQGEFQRVGDNRDIRSDVRLVATSNRNLLEFVHEGGFRQDLYYRLNVLHLHLPSLRERRDDIPLLARSFVQQFQKEDDGQVYGVTAAAIRTLCEYSWPGNVRELRNTLHRACIVGRGRQVDVGDLTGLDKSTEHSLPTWVLDQPLQEIEKWLILENLKRCNGNRTTVAGILGITTRTLANKLKSYNRAA